MSNESENDNGHPDVSRLAGKVSDHVETRVEYLKLLLVEKLALLFLKIISSGIVIAIFLFFFFFVTAAGAFWIGRHYNDYAIGFGLMSLVYLAAALIYLALRKSVFEKKLLDSIVTSLLAEQNPEEDEDEA